MNKKINTVIFLIGATILNLILLIVCMAILIGLFNLVYNSLGEISTALSWLAIIVILFGSIAATFFLYTKIIKWIIAKWKLDRYIEPLFRHGKRRL